MHIQQIENILVKSVNTEHYQKERKSRNALVNELFNKEGKIIHSTYLVYKGHADGAEIHKIYQNGIIEVFNAMTEKHITSMVARKTQLLKYSDNLPKSLLDIAVKHQKQGLNHM